MESIESSRASSLHCRKSISKFRKKVWSGCTWSGCMLRNKANEMEGSYITKSENYFKRDVAKEIKLYSFFSHYATFHSEYFGLLPFKIGALEDHGLYKKMLKVLDDSQGSREVKCFSDPDACLRAITGTCSTTPMCGGLSDIDRELGHTCCAPRDYSDLMNL